MSKGNSTLCKQYSLFSSKGKNTFTDFFKQQRNTLLLDLLKLL